LTETFLTSREKRGASGSKPEPFADALRMEICAGNDPRHLRAIARKLVEKALDGDLQALREVADRLDGKPTQSIDCRDARPITQWSDEELLAIMRRELPEPISDEPSYPMIAGPK
jgi:hypothetical protein